MQAAGVELTEEQRERFDGTEERELALKEPDEVSDAFMHALFSDEPKRRYMVVPNAEEAERTIRKAVEELVQLNDWQAYSFDRDELVQMIDEALTSL
jgi:hypothetical protein